MRKKIMYPILISVFLTQFPFYILSQQWIYSNSRALKTHISDRVDKFACQTWETPVSYGLDAR